VNNSNGFGNRSRRSRRARRAKGALRLAVVVAALLVAAVVFVERRSPVPPVAPIVAPAPLPAPTPPPKPWTSVQVHRLRGTLAAAFAPAIAGATHWSLCVMSAQGSVLFAVHARTGVKPASVTKLVVATTALDVLGGSYRYHTFLVSSGSPDASGTLAGDLWLVGSGDPSLRSTDLAAGVRQLRRQDVRRIAGGVVVDAGAFTGPEINPFWNPQDANEDYQAPVSAISLDGDTIEFDVRGTTPGAPAAVRENPWSGALHAMGGITTVAAADDPSVIVAALASPNHFALSGDVPAGATDREWVPVHGMAHYAGAVLTQLLHEQGVTTAAGPGVGTAPASRIVLWDHASAPLRHLERHMLYLSDNHYAEQLLRTLGLVADGTGDDAHGLSVEREDLARRGVPLSGARLVDGSGLAEADRLSSLTIATILVRALAMPQERGFYDLLPQGGRSGTLENYAFTSALGRVRAKTGHLTGVSSLAGYVVSRHHGIVAFAFMIDGSPGDPDGAMVRAVDRIAEL
jgi:D-alanyl-D-alanine carboxypeptidase/D-alanyl-D-alanine-endopeptidase (penicillin-binding protein 4)